MSKLWDGDCIVRIFLASTTSQMSDELRSQTIQECKPLYFLETFYNGEKKCLKVMKDVGNDNFLLDSGGFSYLNGAKITIEDMEKYINRYIEFIVKNDIKYYFEMDVDKIFGIEIVEKWRNIIEKRTGKQCIPIWHKSRGVEYWKKMCDEYKYIAVGGFALHDIKKQEYEQIKKFVAYANNRNVKVHGLGFTKTKLLKEYRFYSVDSSSWLASSIKGRTVCNFINKELKQRKIDKEDRKINLSKLASHNMKEWIKYQKFMEVLKI